MAQLVKYDVHTTRKMKSIRAIFYHILLFYTTYILYRPFSTFYAFDLIEGLLGLPDMLPWKATRDEIPR